MAWVSIHEGVVGPKLRRLARTIGCSQAEALGILDILWLWGLKNANKFGKIEDALRRDIIAAIPDGMLSDGLSTEKVVDALIATEWIDEVDGQFYLHDWDVWQEQWYKAIERRDYDAKRMREYRQKGAKPAAGKSAGGDKKQNAPEKKKYADFVQLMEREYDKLVVNLGKKGADKCIEVLDNYKGSKGKTYKDDYRAILNWVIKRVETDYPGTIKRTETSEDGKNPFEEWGEQDG